MISSYQITTATPGQSQAVLASCELLSNLSLADSIQERADSSSTQLKPEITLFFAILSAVTVGDESFPLKKYASKVKIAVLGLFANLIGHEDLVQQSFPENASTTIFMAMSHSLVQETAQGEVVRDGLDEILHRALYILDEIIELREVKEIPTAT